MLPQRIGRYQVRAELGRGATSIVYQGVDPVDGRVVAIKALQRNGTDADGDADSIRLRFRNEAAVIGRLRHPGIVAVDEFGEDGLQSWIAMEYVEGCNLDDLLVRCPLLGSERALAIMDELLDAVGCVHRAGICHRDLKPANIMVTPAGRVKLTDFGVARLRDLGLTRVSSIIGTPAFMAPEQFTGGTPDHRADLFSCGVLLFLLLSGRRPFSGAPAAVMHQILHEQAPLLSEASGGQVGRAFDDVMSRALAKQVEQRFASADEMREALRASAALAADSPLATVVETLVQHTGRTHVGRPLGDVQAPPRSGEQRAPARPARPTAPMVLQELAGQPRLVDASTLYSPGADGRIDVPDSPGDADGTLAATLPSGAPPLSAEFCARAQQVLSGPLGPLAGMLVKRAAATARGSRSAFIVELLAQLPAPCPATLHAQLEALLSSTQRETGR